MTNAVPLQLERFLAPLDRSMLPAPVRFTGRGSPDRWLCRPCGVQWDCVGVRHTRLCVADWAFAAVLANWVGGLTARVIAGTVSKSKWRPR